MVLFFLSFSFLYFALIVVFKFFSNSSFPFTYAPHCALPFEINVFNSLTLTPICFISQIKAVHLFFRFLPLVKTSTKSLSQMKTLHFLFDTK